MPSKLCPHIILPTPDLRQFVESGCPLIKLVDAFGPAQELLALCPDLIVIGRMYEPYDANADARSGTAPEAAARALVERQRQKYRLNPLITIWEGPNEPNFGGAEDPANVQAMAWYAAFEAERLRLLADQGLRGVVGNFATGTPDLPLWKAFLPAVEAAQRFQGYLGLHEYSSPWMWWLTGNYQVSNCRGDSNFPGQGDTGWLTLRYRKVYRDYLGPDGLGQAPLIITECGLDRIGAVCPGYSDGPWRSHVGFWRGYDGAPDPIEYWRGSERDPERYYAEQLFWYDRELQKDNFVVGAAIFTVGAFSGGWEPYDIAGTHVAQLLADYIRSQQRAPGAPSWSASARARDDDARAAPEPAPPVSEPAQGPPETIIVPPGSEAARPQPLPNLFINASFEEGRAYFNDNTRQRAVPAGWVLSFYNATAPIQPGQMAPFGPPVTALINRDAVAPEDRVRVFADGAYCWKISGTGSPVWVRLAQSVSGLGRGQHYRFTVNLLPDLIVRTHPQLAYAADPLAGEVRLTTAFAEQSFDTGWMAGRDAPFGQYTRLTLEFAAPSDRVEAAVEVRGRWALPLGAWYIDELSLVAI